MHNRVSPPTLLSYLSALRHHHKMNHFEWTETRNDPLITELLKTIDKNHVHKPINQKSHITRDHLRILKSNLNLNKWDDKAFWAIATTAFYGLARLGELLPTTQQDQNKVPTFRALKFEEINQHTFATIQLARTKNHNTAQRTSLIINPTYDDLCPVEALRAYVVHRLTSTINLPDLLFVRADGSWATKRYFINKLKQALPSEDVAGHSFRAGGTTELVMRGVQLILVQKIGRWSSDTFYRYIRAHPATIAAILIKAYSN